MADFDIGQLFGRQQPHYTDDDLEKIRAYKDAITEFEVSNRETLLAWGALYCLCRPWYDRARRDEAAQSDCQVHGGFMITYDGRIL